MFVRKSIITQHRDSRADAGQEEHRDCEQCSKETAKRRRCDLRVNE